MYQVYDGYLREGFHSIFSILCGYMEVLETLDGVCEDGSSNSASDDDWCLYYPSLLG